MNVRMRFELLWPGLSVLVISVAGCGAEVPSDIVPVTGTVLMDGKPLGGASVQFLPQQGGRPSFGWTDEQGRYSLIWAEGVKGAHVGRHRVQISTKVEADPDENIPDHPETIPANYNVNSELEREVTAPESVYDFELESDPSSGTTTAAN